MERVKAYLFAIARNLYCEQWRRDFPKETLDETMADQMPTPDGAIVQNEEYAHTIEGMNACQSQSVVKDWPDAKNLRKAFDMALWVS